jgi:ankyrin repeat protein
MHFAASAGSVEIIGVLLAGKADINARDEFGRTPLRVALERASLSEHRERHEIVQLLRTHGATD